MFLLNTKNIVVYGSIMYNIKLGQLASLAVGVAGRNVTHTYTAAMYLHICRS